MDVQKWVYSFWLILSLNPCGVVTGADIDVNYEYHECGTTGTYTQDRTYGENLGKLLSSLSDEVNEYGFYNGSVGQDTAERASAIVLCRGDVELNSCRSCVADNSQIIQQLCPTQKEAFRWYNICSVFYSNKTIIGSLQIRPEILQLSSISVQNPVQFNRSLTSLLDMLLRRAAQGGPSLKFAADSVPGPDSQTIYAYVQCTPDLSVQDCTACLTTAFALWSNNATDHGVKIGARVLRPSCFFRYEISSFFSTHLINESLPSPPLPPPPPPPGKKLIIIAVPIAAGLLMLAVCVFVIFRKRQKNKANNDYNEMEETLSIDEISSAGSLQYEFISIERATDNFSEENKIGSGGFGDVYKGKFENGIEFAVKRLSKDSRQGNTEFKAEVALMARLQHRNLVRLLGFCQQGREMLLVYEFVPNGGLHEILFDPVKRGYLNWGRRYKIIEGIARGLVYLHEDSRLRIIHRDLKASNILLDANLNPKIADFGTARLFALDETQGSTSRIIGTYGYMAPEYVGQGQFSIRSDVYSFGVLVLEIISGQKNSSFQNHESLKSLPSYAWTQWRSGEVASSNVIDPMLRGSSSPVHEITKCIHIALLCVQDNVEDRPTMSAVVQMLSNLTMSIPVPSTPGFFIHTRSVSSESSSSIQLSRNEISTSEPNPR